jgi:O-antigen/teichoic acid export membrane protein
MSLHKKAGLLFFGTFIAQSLTFISLPIITRYVSPTEFGKYTQTLFLIATLLPLATLRLESLSVSVSDDKVAGQLAKLGLFSSIFVAILALLTLYVLSGLFPIELGLGQYSILIIAFALASQSFALVLNQFNLRKKRYTKIMKGSVLQNSTTSALQVFSAILNPVHEFLIISFAAGRLSILVVDTRKFREILKSRLDFTTTIILFKRFWKISLILILGAFIETLVFSGINIFVGFEYGQNVAGYLGLALVIFAVPGTLIGSSFTSIIFAEYIPHEKANLKVKKIIKTVVLISITISVGVMFLFAPIANLLLSQTWSESIALISQLGIPIGIHVLWVNCASIMYKNEEFTKYLGFSTLRLLVSIVVASILYLAGNTWQSVVVAYFFSGAIVLLFPICLTYRYVLKDS